MATKKRKSAKVISKKVIPPPEAKYVPPPDMEAIAEAARSERAKTAAKIITRRRKKAEKEIRDLVSPEIFAKFSVNQRKFLSHFVDTGRIGESARRTGISQVSYYNWLKTKPAFKQVMINIQPLVADMIEDEVKRRALEGVEEDIYHQGIIVGQKVNYSDSLITTLIKAHMPEKYRERTSTELTGKDGAPLTMAFLDTILDPPKGTPIAKALEDALIIEGTAETI